ncbi:MAG: YbjN domain-containing protein [Alphaproteobacteria bacterium]
MALIEPTVQTAPHPLDLIEQLAAREEWPFDRSVEDEINLTVTGRWADYQVTFNWRGDLEALHLVTTIDVKVPPARLDEMRRLIAQLNEHLWLGHFDVWQDEGVLLFRYGLLLAGGAVVNQGQCAAMLKLGLETCDRYFPSFQFVIWAGKTAEESIEAAMFETAGSA